jgi:phage baseplate assembly protein W
MAVRQTYKLNPQDLGQPKGIGISILFSNKTSIFNSTITSKDQIKSNLINYILTNKGERLYDPNFGGDIRRALFLQADTTSFDGVIARLETEILSYVPNIILESITLTPQPDFNLVNLVISYQINQQNDSLSINIETNNLNTY